MDDSQSVAIRVVGVNKTFKLPHEKQTSIKGAAINLFRKNRSYEKQKVLKDISFEVKSGEFFGIVGRNGSGKSTLLKLLAGIYTPDKGQIAIDGSLTPFIELGVGFNPELTGRENVFLNGSLLGFNRQEVESMYDEIVAFAELEKFMDQKLKNYSSGMQVRLAFSIAIRAKSDILLVDEVLAVGDSSFQRKCYETFRQLKEEKRTIVFITHDMSAVERFCDRVALVHDSELKGIYKPSKAATEYDKLNAENYDDTKATQKSQNRWGTKQVTVDSIEYKSQGKALKKPIFELGKDLEITLNFDNPKKLNVVVGIAIEDAFGVSVAGPNSLGKKLDNKKATFYINKLPLMPGDYKMTVVLFDDVLATEYDHLEKYYKFSIHSEDHTQHGKVELFGVWK